MRSEGLTISLIWNALLWGCLIPAAFLCLATLGGFLGRWSWFLDLFSHFRVQYAVGLLLLSLIWLLSGHFRTGGALLAFASINAAVVLPLYLPSKQAKAEGPTLRAMLLNVNTYHGNPQRVLQVIRQIDPDVLVLEEVNEVWLEFLQALQTSHPHSCVEPEDNNFGIALLSKLPLQESRIRRIGRAGVPTVVAVLDTPAGPLQIIGTHPVPPIGPTPSAMRNDQLDRLADHVSSDMPSMILGDLNTTPWNYYFQRLLRRTGFQDSLQGWGVQPTWPTAGPLLGIPLDHCLHSPEVLILRREVGPYAGSDHYPVIIEFALEPQRADGS